MSLYMDTSLADQHPPPRLRSRPTFRALQGSIQTDRRYRTPRNRSHRVSTESQTVRVDTSVSSETAQGSDNALPNAEDDAEQQSRDESFLLPSAAMHAARIRQLAESVLRIHSSGDLSDDEDEDEGEGDDDDFIHEEAEVVNHTEGEDRHITMPSDTRPRAGILRSSQSRQRENRNVDEFDEDGVRRPDPVRQQRLIGGSGGGGGGGGGGMNRNRRAFDRYGGVQGMGMGMGIGSVAMMGEMMELGLGRAEDPDIDWFFPPPNHLSHAGSLEVV
jgi:hypothetical protein